MAIGRISGPLLKANLTRNGVDLAFENDLLYLDVSDPNPANHKIGIKKTNPQYTLDVQGTIQATQIISPNIEIENLDVQEVQSDLIPDVDSQYVLGTPARRWKSLDVDQLTVNALQFDYNTITIVDSNADIELRPVGSGTVWINTDQALRIPYGNELTRPSGLTAQIRFNTDNLQFEGYNGAGWVSLGATRDVDGNTQITAELTTGANDNTFRFYNDGTLTGTWDINRLDLHKLTVDNNLVLDNNTISTVSGNTNLVLGANGTGKVYIPSNNLDIDNDLNVDGITTLDETTIDGTLAVNGTATITDIQVTNDLNVTGNIFGDYVQTNDIRISGSVITTTVGDNDLQLRANGNGEIRLEESVTITGNTVMNGTLQIDGQVLSASTTTFNLVNNTATTVNFAGAATAIEIGATTGTTSINHSLTVDGNVTLGNAGSDTVLINASTVNVPNQMFMSIEDANNTFVSYPLNVRHTTTGGASNGIGTGIRFITETGNDISKIGMSLDAVTTDVTSATEDFDFVVRLMDDGNLAAERFRVSSLGDGTLVGNLAVNGGTVSTTASTVNLVNSNATRVNFAGDAARIEIGSSSGTTNINNSLDVDGNLNVDGSTISTTSSTLNLANTTTTTVNAFGAATTINIGADSGTTTINNDLVVDGGVTVNNQSEIRFRESEANGNEYVSIKSPESLQESYLLKLPINQGSFGQLLTNAGEGQLQWSPADTLVGNRLYVSARYGDDNNNGFDAPVKTLKRAAELMDQYIYTPKRTVSQAERDTETIIKANKEFLKAEVIGYIKNYFSFEYNKATCARDTGLIVQSLAFDLLFNGNTQSTFAGLQYWAKDLTNVPGQVAETVAAIEHTRDITWQIVQNIPVTKQVGNSQTQDTSLPAASKLTADAIEAKFNLILGIIDGTHTNITNSIINNGPATTDADLLKAFDILQANKLFIQDDTIAYVDNFFAFTYQPLGTAAGQALCARDTGFIVQSLAFDLLYNGSTQSSFAALRYYDKGTSNIPVAQLEETLAAIERAKFVASQVVLNQPVPPSSGNTTPQVFNLDNPGSGAGATIISNNFDRIISIVGDVSNLIDISGTIVDNGPRSTSNSIINTYNLLLANKDFIRDETIAWINSQIAGNISPFASGFVYDQLSCADDVEDIVECVAVDLIHGGNRQSTQAGVYYYGFDAGDINIPTEIPQTISAYTYLKTLVEKVVLDQEPTIRYQNSVERVAGLPATVTEVNAIKADIDLIINIIENGPAVAPLPQPIAINGYTNTTNVLRAFTLLRDNVEFIKAELIGYIAATFSTIVGYDSVKCKRDTGYIIDSISFDTKYGGNRQTIQAGVYYFNKSASTSVTDEFANQRIQTVAAFNYLKTVAAAVIQGISYTPLQNVVAIDLSGSNGTSNEYNIIEADINRIINIVQNGPSVAEAAQSIGLTAETDADIVAAYNRLLANEEFIKAEVTQYIDNEFTGLVYNEATCSRDVGYILDAVTYDLTYGGNAKTIYSGNRYYQGSTSTNRVLNEQKPETVAAITYLAEVAEAVLEDTNPTNIFGTVSRVSVADLNVTTTTLQRAAETAAIKASIELVADILDNPGIAPPIDYGPGYFAATGSIFVASGDYVENNPIIIPDNVSVIGADLRSVIIRPQNSKKDMFRLRNGSYMSGFTWRDNIDPITKIPQFTWDFATTFDNPADTTLSRGEYPYTPLTKPIITQSPYIQNVSIISFLGGSGALIDGNLVVTPNIPAVLAEVEVALNVTDPNTIPEQGKSMVANAYTMVSFGGIGWKLINDAYAQIVSCFQIFLLEGVVCQSGGYCSITNSATNFGLYALRASGYSPNAFVFDRAWIANTGVSRGKQTLTTIGTKRTPVNEFVVRIRTQNDAQDITTNYLTEREQFYFPPTAVNPATDIFTVLEHGLGNRQRVTYFNNGGVSIGGLENGVNYYVFQISPDEFKLYFDETLTIPVDITSVGSGGQLYDTVEPIGGAGQPDPLVDSTLHRFAFVVEEFFIDEIIESHSVFQKLTLSATPGVYNFVPGTTITGTTVIEGETLPNNAYVYSWNQGTRELVVAVNQVVVDDIPRRVTFNDTSIITEDQSTVKIVDINVDATESVTGLVSSTFTIESTIVNSLLQGVAGLPGLRAWLHRPSIVNSSSHTWEYAGSGIDYNALPQNGGQTREEFEQFNEPPGRVYTSGTNELGDFKVGDFIVAENKTGNISFRNEVTVGQLNALRLSLSDIEINKISNDPGLGDNEPGGPSDSALVTQLAIRTFIQNRLGPVIDKRVSTNANAGALVQLNSSGQINRDLIPPLRTTNTVTVKGFLSRLDVSEDQPAIDVLASDTVVENYFTRTLTLSGPITISRGDIIRQSTSGAYGQAVLDVTAGTSVEVADIIGTFTTNPAHILTNDGGTPLGDGTVYPTVIGTESEQEVPYVLTTDTISQFLILFDKTTGADYSFTPGNLVTSTINPAVGSITEYKSGIVVELNTLSYNKGTNYTPTTGTAVYLNVPLTPGGINPATGTGAVADITVTNGQVANVDLRRGGTGYVVGQTLTANNANIGGTGSGFSITITDTEQRLYVDLVDGVKFIPTSTVFDFIADNNAPVKTITSLTATIAKTFLAEDDGSGGNVDYDTSRITITTHGYTNGDPVVYTSGVNLPIGSLGNNTTYYIKVITVDQVELYLDYNLATKVNFTQSSVGTHTLTILRSNILADTFYIPAHGFVTGDPIEITGADVPSALTAARYYVGSVTTNSFTLHQLRLDALASVGGLSVQKQDLGDTGSGSMTFTLQNVTLIGNINTSSTNEDAFVLLSTTNVDASNIISGIIATSRLATGTANTDTFLRGDSTWQTVVQSVRPNTDSPISITGPFVTVIDPINGNYNEYYGDLKLDVIRASNLLGDDSFTNQGVAGFSKGQFDVTDGKVSIIAGRIDALSLGGLQASYFLDPSNLTSPVPVNRGGTGLNSLPAGSLVYGSTSTTATALPLGTANSILVSNGTTPEWSPNLTLVGNLTVDGDTTIGNASNDSFTINAGTVSVPNALLLDLEDSSNGSVSYPLSIRHSATGVPGAGIGTGLQFITETSGNNFKIGTVFESLTTSVTPTAERFEFILKLMTNGATASQALRVSNNRITVGAANTTTTITTNGLASLVLSTNNHLYTSTITIAQGFHGNITLAPSGTGVVNIEKTTNITGNLTVSGTTSIGGVFLSTNSVTGLTLLTDVDTFSRLVYRSAKYTVQVQCTAGPDAGSFQASEILVIHNGTTAFMTEYAVVKTGANTLGVFEVDVSGDSIRLRVTPTASDTINVRVTRLANQL